MAHLVLTARDCVMVEERRVSVRCHRAGPRSRRLPLSYHHKPQVYFLDEVAYFLRRAAGWHTMPIIYPFLREGLADPRTIESVVATPLLERLRPGDVDKSCSSASDQVT